MKPLVTFMLIVLWSNFLQAQDANICTDLFISEVLYGYHEDSLPADATYATKSYAIEVYNPTNSAINLSNYKVELVYNDASLANESFSLSGTIDSQGVIVIANSDADSAVLAITDYTHADFKFDSFVQVQLMKNTIELDEIGQRGVANPDTIVIDSILNNPTYLGQVNIDLSSVHNLIARRNARVKDGDSSFTTAEVLDQWEFYPDDLIGGLGEHECVCGIGYVEWVPTNSLGSESIVYIAEGDYDRDYHEYPIIVDGQFSKDTDIKIQDNGITSHPIVASSTFDYIAYYDASRGDYYRVKQGTYYNQQFTIKTILTVDDNFNEGVEGVPLKIESSPGDYAVGFPNTLDIGITDNPTGMALLDKSAFNVVPTIFHSAFTIEKGTMEELEILEITVYNVDGKVLYRDNQENQLRGNISISITNDNVGYVILRIKTDKGTFTQKLLQVH